MSALTRVAVPAGRTCINCWRERRDGGLRSSALTVAADSARCRLVGHQERPSPPLDVQLSAQFVGCIFAALVLMSKKQLVLGILLIVLQVRRYHRHHHRRHCRMRHRRRAPDPRACPNSHS